MSLVQRTIDWSKVLEIKENLYHTLLNQIQVMGEAELDANDEIGRLYRLSESSSTRGMSGQERENTIAAHERADKLRRKHIDLTKRARVARLDVKAWRSQMPTNL